MLTDLSQRDLGTTVFGRRIELPVMLGPAGMHRLVAREGEVATARAARTAGTVFALSASSNRTIEEVAAAAPGAHLWFQLYLWDSRAWSEHLVRRAAAAGYEVLCVTVDTKAPGARKYRDLRNGLLDPRVYARSALDAVRRPRWVANFLLGPRIRGVHLPSDGGKPAEVSLFKSPSVIARRMDPSATWDEIRWLRGIWQGPLVVKGVLTAEDATLAFEQGADGVICSNHGGRVLDGVAASLDALPRVVEAAARARKEVFIDGGIRTGGDVVKAIALGARACLIGRPYWWGLAVGGEHGAARVLEILRAEIDGALLRLGRRTIADLDRSVIERLPFLLPAAR